MCAGLNLKDNLGIKYALAKKRVDVELAGTQFTDVQKQQIAASVLLVDKYANSFLQQKFDDSAGGSKIFKDLSQDEIDPGKMLLAIDYAFSTGRLADFADGTTPSVRSVGTSLEAYFQSKRGDDLFRIGPDDLESRAKEIYDAGQKTLIENLHRIISNQVGGSEQTILGGVKLNENSPTLLNILLRDLPSLPPSNIRINRGEVIVRPIQREQKEEPSNTRSITVTPQGIQRGPEDSLLRANIPDSVEDKVTFVSRIFKDNPDETMFMKRLVNQESLFGKAKGTYEISGKMGQRGSYGVAQVDEVAFNAVKNKLLNPKSSLSKYIDPFEKATGIDLTTVNYEDLTNDTLSIAFGRMYLMQLTEDPIPSSKEDQAKYWKTYYNTKAGKGTVKEFLNTNKDL